MKCNSCNAEWNAPNSNPINCPFCGKPIIPEKTESSIEVQEILRNLVQQYGDSLFQPSNKGKLSGLLSDYLSHNRKLLKILQLAIQENIPFHILSCKKEEQDITLKKLITNFKTDNFIEESISIYVVNCFAYALGITCGESQLKKEVNKKSNIKKAENIVHKTHQDDWLELECYKSKDRYGYKNATGKIVIPAQYKGAEPFNEGFAAVQNDDYKWAFIDSTGKKICHFKYDRAESFSDGLAAVRFNSRWGFINEHGVLVIPIKYESVFYSFVDGEAKVREGGDHYYINKSGERIDK